MFFRGHSVLKILTFDHVIEGGQIVGYLIKKTKKYDKKPNKTLSISTALIIIKIEGFWFSEKFRLGFLNWPFGFQPKISFVFHKNLCWFSWRA